MPVHMRNPYEAPEASNNPRLYIDLILLSLLAHAVLITLILMIAAFTPRPAVMDRKPAPPSTVSLSLMPEPQKPIFMPTNPDPNAKHIPQRVESANDTELQSQSKTARNPNSIMPDVTGKEHNPDLNNSPNVKSQKPEVSSTPPVAKQAKPEKPTPPQPKPQQAQPTPPQPPSPPQKPAPPKPPEKPQPQVDANGFPVLPPLAAPTLAQANPTQASQPLAPAPSDPLQATSSHGALGRHGDNTPAAMASALGKYKQKVYYAVGSRWYPKVNSSFQIIGVGAVHIQFTIHSDGTVETKVLDAGDNSAQTLLSISINSIREAAPFDPFPPEMVKELVNQGGDGNSYTDDFTFSVYGN